ncbi:MAG TPA: autotransporter-associated beta strand repeat-containing protein [Terrimicrobiaceae bacterium]|nr:autotransporter-associated beta strand repeat-containing protein [Terrimicrobiaceae bacterium]
MKLHPHTFKASLTTALGILALSWLPNAQAQTSTWDGGAANNNWTSAANWVGDTAPVSGTSTVLLFTGSNRLTPFADASYNISRIEFLAGASSFDLVGSGTLSPFSINGTTTAAIVNNSSVLQTISAPMAFTTSNLSYTFNAAAGDLQINSNIAASNNRLILTGSAGRTVTMNGTLSGAGSAVASLVLNTANLNLVMKNANTYTGQTFISRGTAYVQTNNAFGAGSTIQLAQNTTPTDAASILIDGAYSVGQNIILNKTVATGTATTTLGGSSAHDSSFTGTITMGSTGTFGRALTVTAANGGKVTFSGNILTSGTDNSDSITKIGQGTVVFSGSNTYKGITQINAGTLLVNGSHSGGGAYTVASTATLGGTGTITEVVNINSGGFLLAGTGTAASGTLTIAGNTTFADGSTIELTLGASGVHSTLARSSGTWTFDSDQAFNFINQGATAGFYDNIITGLAGDPGVGSWTIANAGWVGTFAYDGSNNVDLTLSAVPEPTSVALFVASLGFAVFFRKRTRQA